LTSVASAEENEKHLFMGAGAEKCSRITETYQSTKNPAALAPLDIMIGSWIGGFMTAANYISRLAAATPRICPRLLWKPKSPLFANTVSNTRKSS
jgi:hypothetical protein